MLKTEQKEVKVVFKGKSFSNYIATSEGLILKNNNPLAQKIVNGRLYVTIVADDKTQYYCQVSEIILESFEGRSDEENKYVGFRDGDSHNTKVENLFWTNSRNWWLDERVNISSEIRDEVMEEIMKEEDHNTSVVSKRLNMSKRLVDHIAEMYDVILNPAYKKFDDVGDSLLLEDVVDSSIRTMNVVMDIQQEEDEEQDLFQEAVELFTDTLIVENSYKTIIEYELPALKYAGISNKKIHHFILYKYGKDVYEYFISNYKLQ